MMYEAQRYLPFRGWAAVGGSDPGPWRDANGDPCTAESAAAAHDSDDEGAECMCWAIVSDSTTSEDGWMYGVTFRALGWQKGLGWGTPTARGSGRYSQQSTDLARRRRWLRMPRKQNIVHRNGSSHGSNSNSSASCCGSSSSSSSGIVSLIGGDNDASNGGGCGGSSISGSARKWGSLVITALPALPHGPPAPRQSITACECQQPPPPPPPLPLPHPNEAEIADALGLSLCSLHSEDEGAVEEEEAHGSGCWAHSEGMAWADGEEDEEERGCDGFGLLSDGEESMEEEAVYRGLGLIAAPKSPSSTGFVLLEGCDSSATTGAAANAETVEAVAVPDDAGGEVSLVHLLAQGGGSVAAEETTDTESAKNRGNSGAQPEHDEAGNEGNDDDDDEWFTVTRDDVILSALIHTAHT